MKSGKDGTIENDLAAMRRYARVLTRDPQDADDVVQDAIVRAIERHQTYRPDHARRNWLLTIVHNVFISAKRREAAEARRDNDFAEAMIARIDAEQRQRDRLAQVARAFAALPEHHRTIMHLIAVEGLSYQAASEVLQVPIGTVMSRLARARLALRASETDQAQPVLRVVGGKDD